MIHVPAMAWTPVPVQRIAAVGMPVPLDIVPKQVDCRPQAVFALISAGKKLTGAEQSHHQEGGFNEIAAVVLFRKFDGTTGRSVHEMRKNAVIGFRPRQEFDDA